MAEMQVSKTVAAPIERVFTFFTDIGEARERIAAIARIEPLTGGPAGVGTRFRETRILFKKEATEEITVTAFEPNRLYTLESESFGTHYTNTFTFTPENRGTRVDVRFTTRPLSFAAKLMAPLAWLIRNSVKKAIEQDLEDLKTAAEKGTRREPGGRRRRRDQLPK